MKETQRMLVGSHAVEVMNANAPRAGEPPQPASAEHWAAWLQRYGDDYVTDDERRAAYQDFKTNPATLQTAFGSQPGAGEP
jgi:hypothetical protein